jgi:DNA helicase-2/ATP-dependent DNA helicase PcrA
VTEAPASYTYGGYGSRFDRMEPFNASSYTTPGWQRAQRKRTDMAGGGSRDTTFGRDEMGRRGRGRYDDDERGGFSEDRSTRDEGFGGPRSARQKKPPTLIEGELVAKSTGTASRFSVADRVFHQKFGPGSVAAVDGNKLTVDFDKAGRKMVLDSFVQRG